MVGTYYFQTHFPEQILDVTTQGVPAGTIREASSSEEISLVVQNEPLEFYAGNPLPSEYWTRPIDSQFWEWASISGSWLQGAWQSAPPNRLASYTLGPESPHILWAKPLWTGGLAGGELGNHGYATGDAYKGKFQGSVIINGVLYYNRYHTGFVSTFPIEEVVALDLCTGEEKWVKNWDNQRLAFGQIFYFDSFNQHGAFAYLWTTSGSTWNAYDPFTGEWVYAMENVPSGTNIYGPNGEIYRYTVNLNAGWMTLWSSRITVNPGNTGVWAIDGSWGPEGSTYDSSLGIVWNVSIPTGLPGTVRMARYNDRIIGLTIGTGIGTQMLTDPVRMWGISTAEGSAGTLLFNTTWTPPDQYLTIRTGAQDGAFEDGVFTLWIKELRQHYGFDMDTGTLIWGPTEPQAYLDALLWGPWHHNVAYGTLISSATSGIVYAYDVKTGNLKWKYEGSDPYKEILWSNNWPVHQAFFADGKIYIYYTEHSTVDPKNRGSPFIALDVETGEVVFRVDGAFRGTYWGNTAIIADGIIAYHNTYDQRIYAIGKGPTSLTVTTPDTAVSLGSQAVIKGTITDVSAGTKDPSITARFPNGVAAISDEDMGEWMKYVYMQIKRPTDAVGVPVKIQVVDPNGQYAWIGTATSDAYGNYRYLVHTSTSR